MAVATPAGIQMATTGLRIESYAQAHESWRQWLARSPRAGLYHGERWLELLRRVYRMPLSVAQVELTGEGQSAACVLAHPHRFFSPRAVALPFSDYAPPLTTGARAEAALLEHLAHGQWGPVELRGQSAPPPWQVSSTFALWNLDLRRPLAQLQAGLATNFRRNLKRAARALVHVEYGADSALLARFHALHSESRRRHGLPAPPARFFRVLGELFAPNNELEVWIASRAGRDLAGVVLLRSGKRLYYKWGARAGGDTFATSHLLLWQVIERAAGHCEVLDLGRADIRNVGLSRFKAELGARAEPLPYAFMPRMPRNLSAEHLSGLALLLSQLWKRLPPPLARILGGAIYGLLS
ncbi:MAG TPA: GNAT family N-acetyltransferase [Candidatus Binataceae bacterium]|nr:GNAT family N-acetyltransferase [Candidatus Binataceae bacterium]